MSEKRYELSLGVSTLIGTRPDQQDSVYAENLGRFVMAVLCDGMGGLQGGALASQKAMQTFVEDYEKRDKEKEIPLFLKEEIIKMDQEVARLCDEQCNPLKAGTTVAAIIIDADRLYWAAVGDSRIYVMHGNQIRALNRDHNYHLRLNMALKSGSITQETYEKEKEKGEALISYLGMGNVSLMDLSVDPIAMQDGDIIILCSDGLYRALTDEDIKKVCIGCLPDTQKAADKLTEQAILSSLDNQDNTTTVVIEYRSIKDSL